MSPRAPAAPGARATRRRRLRWVAWLAAAGLAGAATVAVAALPPWSAPLKPPHSPKRSAPRGGAPAARGSAAPRPAADWARIPVPELPENAPVEHGATGDWIGAHDLARLLGATKFWRGDLRKLELRTAAHRIQLTVDNPFVLIDDRTLMLPLAVHSVGGQLRVPVALIDSLPRDEPQLIYDAHRGLALRVPPEGLVRSPRVEASPGSVRITIPTGRPDEAAVVGRSRTHFRLRVGGLFVGAVPDTLPAGGLLRSARAIPAATGSAFEFVLAPEARAYRIETTGHGAAVELLFAREPGAGLEPFAPEGPGPRRVKVIVIDPGHGGDDAGVIAGGVSEKDLTLQLARTLARQLEQRLGARVVLTRADDRGLTIQQRAETANRAGADLVLSLHFDGAPSPVSHGATAYVAPATFAGGSEPEPGAPAPVDVLPWRDVATRHAVRSRELAEAVLAAIELRGFGPTRMRELLPVPLLGVNAPGLMLECATLTSVADRARVTSAHGLEDLARAIAAGLDAYRRAD